MPKPSYSARNISKSLAQSNFITIDPGSRHVPGSSAPVVGLDGKPQRPPRGHKQKGAGTVIVAKPDVVTGDGVVLKAHERLPTQLLQEYCQREKRPAPRYHLQGPGLRHAVQLPDKKDPKCDLRFLPKDTDFESHKVAKDYSALLALFELQRNMPLENKLPSPYRDSWKAMVNAAKEAERAEKRPGRGGASAAAPTSASQLVSDKTAAGAPKIIRAASASLKDMEKESATVAAPTGFVAVPLPVLDPSTADWLCCSCNQQNFAKLNSGTLRTKCFKCGVVRSEECEMVASTAPVAAPAQAPTPTSFKIAADDEDTPSFGFTEPKKKSGAENMGLGGKQFKMGKAPPQARLQLENKHQYNSTAEAQRMKDEMKAMQKRKQCYWDAVKRANRPTTVVLSPQLRARLEAALGLESFGGMSPSPSEGELEDWVVDSGFTSVSKYLASLSRSDGLISPAECGLQATEQFAALEAISALLIAQGFREAAIVNAFVGIAEAHENVLDEIAVAGGSRRWQKIMLDATLEWLCVRLDNVELPKKYDARQNEGQMQIRRAEVLSAAQKEPNDSAGHKIEDANDEFRAYRTCMREYGWSAEEAHAAIAAAEGDMENALPKLLCLLVSATLAAAREAGEADCVLVSIASEEAPAADWLEAVQDEAEMLASIFGDTREVKVVVEGSYVTVSVDLFLGDAISSAPRKHFLSGMGEETASLHMIVSAGMHYPTRPPLLLLKYNAARSAKVLMALNLALWRQGAQLAGDSLMYQIVLWLEQERGGAVEEVLCSPHCAPGAPVHIQAALLRIASGAPLVLPPQPPAAKELSSENGSTTDEQSVSSAGSKRRYGKDGKHPFWSRDNRDQGPLLYNPEIAATLAQKQPTPGARAGRAREEWLGMLVGRKNLPAWGAREKFLSTILQNRGMVVTGETGCGKTTQIPQYLLEAQPNCKILVCQPRRLAAVGVANRVASEMACKPGEAVGYMVRGDSACGARTRLAFCTYGVLLRRLLQDPDLDGVDYVVLDEVHERGMDSDFGLGLLAAALGRPSCSFKLILMSATISTDKFAAYLGRAVAGAFTSAKAAQQVAYNAAPVLHIPGYTFDVTEYYKNDFEEALRDSASNHKKGSQNNEEDDYGDSGGGRGGGSSARIGGEGRKGDLDYDILVRCCMKLATGDGTSGGMFSRATGSILLFLPGVPEIMKFCTLLRDAWGAAGGSVSAEGGAAPARGGGRNGAPALRILPLHAGTPSSEQQRIFEDARPGELKIIAATNVAEASITIPDVSVVVDSCRVKETDFDPEKQMNALILKFASKDSLRQRRGRAGRVAAGRCFRAVTSNTYASLPNHSIPEILRASLDSLVLQIKSMSTSTGNSKETVAVQLARCPDPPALGSVAASEGMLTRMQAIDSDGNITPLGKHLAALPCAPRVGRLLVYGCLLNCALPLANVAALLSARSPFLATFDQDQRAEQDSIKTRLAAAAGGRSDQLIIVAACAGFESCSGAAAQRRYCQEHMLSYPRMQEIRQLTRELLGNLGQIGLIQNEREARSPEAPCNSNAASFRIVAAAISAGMYPQVAKILRPPKRFEEVMGSALEKQATSKEIKFYVPLAVHSQWSENGEAEDGDVSSLPAEGGDPHNPRTGGGGGFDDADAALNKNSSSTDGMYRVFVHPSSIHFGNTSFGQSQYVMYGETRLSAAPGRDSKSMIQDLTEVSAYPLLFFGGKVEGQYLQGTITVDGWLQFSASGKLVALIQALRRALDALLMEKIENPGVNHQNSPVLKVVCEMLNSADGLR